jgi:Flp pilus assembly protein TadG
MFGASEKPAAASPEDCPMPSPVSAVSLPRLLRRFRRNRRGSTAVEFALIAPVFFALLFAIIEAGLMFLAGQVLETVAQESARMILTGQAQNQSYSSTDFAQYVCGQVPALFDCNNISIDVESYNSFSGVTTTPPIDNNGNFVSNNLRYSPGTACSTVMVRLFYQWPLFVTGLGWNPSNLTGNKRLLIGTAAFKNEPYTGGGCPAS